MCITNTFLFAIFSIPISIIFEKSHNTKFARICLNHVGCRSKEIKKRKRAKIIQ